MANHVIPVIYVQLVQIWDDVQNISNCCHGIMYIVFNFCYFRICDVVIFTKFEL